MPRTKLIARACVKLNSFQRFRSSFHVRMIFEGASPRLHPSKTLTTRTIIDLSLPWVIERSDAPILNLSPKEQTRVHNLINDPRTADDRVFG